MNGESNQIGFTGGEWHRGLVRSPIDAEYDFGKFPYERKPFRYGSWFVSKPLG